MILSTSAGWGNRKNATMMHQFPFYIEFNRRSILGSIMGIMVIGVLFSGCARHDSSELELLIREDPNYRNLIEVKIQVEGHIEQLRTQMSERKDLVEEKIKGMREAYRMDADGKDRQISKLRDKLKAIKLKFGEDLTEAKSALREKEELQSQLSAALKDAQDIIDQKDSLQLTGSDLVQWQSQISKFERRLDPLGDEIAELKAEVALTSKKLKYL